MQPEDIPRAAPPVVVIYGQESENEALADELALDGFNTRLVSDPASVGEVDLIVFGRALKRGAGLGALRALRRGGLAGSGARVLWISTSSDATDTLRAFEAGADDVWATASRPAHNYQQEEQMENRTELIRFGEQLQAGARATAADRR